MAGLCIRHQGRSLHGATFSCRTCGACRLQTAINNAAEQASTSSGDRRQGAGAKHLKPIQTAVELVFGSAAALSATFGYKVCTPWGHQALHSLLCLLWLSDEPCCSPHHRVPTQLLHRVRSMHFDNAHPASLHLCQSSPAVCCG